MHHRPIFVNCVLPGGPSTYSFFFILISIHYHYSLYPISDGLASSHIVMCMMMDIFYFAELQLYREDIPTCSELCVCEFGRLEVATCTVLECLETTHCYVKTEDEYAHLQPTYIAHRGNCKCYAGRFICEKPPPGKCVPS
jgi:hypothetical protein